MSPISFVSQPGSAEPVLRRALAIRESSFGANHPNVAASLNELAMLYRAQGNFGAAEPLLVRALTITEDYFGKVHPNVGVALNNLALFYRAQGDFSAAESLLMRSLIIAEATPDDDRLNVAYSLHFLAGLYRHQGNNAAAEPFYRRSLAIREAALGPNHFSIAESLNNLAAIYRSQGNLALAEQHLRRSLTILETIYGADDLTVATGRNNLAALYSDQGNDQAAELLYQQSLAVMESALGESHPNVAHSLHNLATFYRDRGNFSKALALLKRNTEAEETNLAINLAIGSETRKRYYIDGLAGTTNFALSLHLLDLPTNAEAARLAFTTLLRRKGRILEAVTDTQTVLRQNLRPDLQVLLEAYNTTQRQLAARLYSETTQDQVYQAELAALRQRSETLANELARRSAEFRVATQPVEIEAVQALIPSHGVLVEWVQYRPFNPDRQDSGSDLRYAAYLLTPSGELQWVDLGDAATIDQQIQAFLEILRCGETLALPCYDPEDIKPVARALDALVMAPIRPLLGNASHLLLSPDSQLNLLPFAALVDEQDRYLVETYTLTHLTSGRDLLRLQNPAPSRQPPVVLANPDFDEADASGIPMVAAASRGGARSADMANLRFGPLKGSEQEVEALRPLLARDAVILTEAEATENALKQVQGPHILHLATHGFFLPNVPASPPATDSFAVAEALMPASTIASAENPLLRAGLALAGFNRRQSEGEDGVLTAMEVASLDLRGTRLVVMSACETGVGDVANGEGVYGLRRAFVMAGAESQVMSLWKVSDRGTADLMQQYYQRLGAGEGRSEALRQVQLEALQTRATRHPYHWAAFFFSGQWSPMDSL